MKLERCLFILDGYDNPEEIYNIYITEQKYEKGQYVRWTPELQEAWDIYQKQKECKYCTDGYTTLIDSTKISNMTYFFSSRNSKITDDDIDDVDNSVVFEVRNGHGYIRLGDRGDMGCLDHGDKVEIDNCPFCGRKLG